jgi:hypothetical protein
LDELHRTASYATYGLRYAYGNCFGSNWHITFFDRTAKIGRNRANADSAPGRATNRL